MRGGPRHDDCSIGFQNCAVSDIRDRADFKEELQRLLEAFEAAHSPGARLRTLECKTLSRWNTRHA